MLIHNAVLTGSISLNGSDVSNITGSAAYSASFSSRITNNEATGSTLTAASSSFSTRVTNNEATGSTLTAASSSFSTRTTNIEATGSTLISASSSFSTRTTTLEAASASFSTRVTSLTVQTGSYATTGSNSFKSDQIITGSIALTGNITASNALYSGNITAQTLIVQTVTSSVLFSTGSNKIGSSLSNVQELTGSVGITGSLSVNTNGTEFQVSAGGVNIGNALTDNHVISGSLRVNANGLFVSSSGNVGIGTTTLSASPNYTALNINGTTGSEIYLKGSNVDYGYIYANSSAVVLATQAAIPLNLQTNATTRLSISSSGAATFSNDVTIGSPTANATLNISGDNGGGDTFLNFRADIGTIKAQIQGGKYAGTGGVLYLKTLQSSVLTTAMVLYQSNIGIGASTTPSYLLEVSTAGGSQRIRVGTLQNNSNTATFEAITSSAISTATSGWIRAVYGGGLALGTSTYTKAGGDSGNFANLSAEVQTVAMTINGGGVDLNNPTTIGKNSNAGSCIGFTENQIYRTGNGILYLQEYSTNHIIALNGGGNFLIGTSTNLGYRLFANGTAAGLSNWNNVSDGRLKKDVTPVINGLDKIKQLNGITFNWDKTLRPDLNLDDNNHLGLIAQDVEEILPQVVTTGDDEFGTKTIAYSDIVPVLIEAIKELSAKNTALEEILQRNNIQ